MRKNIGVMLAILTLYFAGCAGAAETIRIGVYNCLSGPNATAGRMEVEGIQLAHKEMPEVLGRQIELVVADNKSDMAEAAVVVARLIEKDRVVAILGSYGSSLAMAGGGVAAQHVAEFVEDDVLAVHCGGVAVEDHVVGETRSHQHAVHTAS